MDHRKRPIGNGPELLLIPCIILAMSGPFISSARGAAFVMVGLLVMSAVSIRFLKIGSRFLRLSVSTALLVGLGTAFYLGWEKLEPRLMNIFMDNLSGRTQIYVVTNKMIDEYPIFGSGPGSFEAVTQFELGEKFNEWVSWAHNDYLEFFLTFGKPGCAIIITLTVIFAIQFLALFFRSQSPKSQMFWILGFSWGDNPCNLGFSATSLLHPHLHHVNYRCYFSSKRDRRFQRRSQPTY